MTTRCLRLRSPVLQFLRYVSNSAKSGGQRPSPSEAPVQATLEASPIFGTVKRAPAASVAKSIPADLKMSKPRLKQTEKAPKAEEPKKPLTEDEKMYTYKSMRLHTSIKKLGNLSRQIAHKDIDHAIAQMRFSPKRAARTILRGLEHAKEEAIRLQDMKDGQIVLDQAWVGRNGYRKQRWIRARGRMNIRMRPFSHFTVLLRSQETVNKRIERVKMRKLEKMVRRPSETRPIYNPRPYYTW